MRERGRNRSRRPCPLILWPRSASLHAWNRRGGPSADTHSVVLCVCVSSCSQGIKANGFVFVSGCLGLNPKTGEITGDVVAQTKQVSGSAPG